MHQLLIGVDAAAVRVVAPRHDITNQLRRVFAPWWNVVLPVPRPRSITVHLDDRRHTDLVDLVDANDPDHAGPGGALRARDPWGAMIAYAPQAAVSYRVPVGDEPVHIAGTDLSTLGAATALLARDLIRADLEALGWRLVTTSELPHAEPHIRAHPLALVIPGPPGRHRVLPHPGNAALDASDTYPILIPVP